MKKIYSAALIICGLGIANAQVFNAGDYTTMTDVSNTGVAVGNAMNMAHVMWNEGSGSVVIGEITGQEPLSGTTNISNDGKYISGSMTHPESGKEEMARYNTATNAWTYLGSLGPETDGSSAWGMTGDGATVVGLGWYSGWEAHAVKWTQAGGVVDIGSTVTDRSSRANGISDNGQVVVGWQDDDYGDRFAVYWKDGVQNYIMKNNAKFTGEGQSVTPDGNTIVGSSEEAQAFIWNATDGYTGINHPDPMYVGGASGVSDDGKVVVGFFRPWASPASAGEGFIWTKETGAVNLNEYVMSLGYDTLGITFALPMGLSPDGKYIVGLGKTDGALTGFVIKLPNLATNESVSKSKVSIYPNPVKNILNITSANKIADVEIYNFVGQKIATEALKNNTLDVSELAKGAYVLKVKNGSASESIKFIKE